MLILFALLLACGLVALCRRALKSHSALFYGGAAAVSLLVGLVDCSFLPTLVQNTLLALLTRGAFATALWILVMWAGALKNGSRAIRALMPVRGELSILAAFLTLGHNLFYGRTYFVRLFTDASSLPGTQRAAAILSLVMILLLLPLTVTSFPAVRRKLPARRWKALQRWAYLYYALLFAHILLVSLPGALAGKCASIVSVLAYTAIFASYACFRVRKYLVLKKKRSPRATLCAAVALSLCALLLCTLTLWLGNRPAPQAEPPAQAEAPAGSVTVSGHAYGYDGEVYVTVTLENSVMTQISAYTEESDDYYFDHCYEKVVAAILETQNPQVDAVSGATYSSQAIMDATEAALKPVK